MEIRIYQSNDFDAIIELIRLNTPKYFSIEEEVDLENYLNFHLDLYYVVVLNEKIIGCGGINYTDEKNTVRLSWDIIHPNKQGKGIGRLLTQFRLEEIKKMNQIENIVVRTSQHAATFYQKQGFHLTEIVTDYWAKGFDLYYMVKVNA